MSEGPDDAARPDRGAAVAVDDHADYRRRPATFEGDYRRGSLTRGAREFVHRYGWRAYALPALVVITVLALVTTGRGDGGHGSGAAAPKAPAAPTGQASQAAPSVPPTAAPTMGLKSDQPGANARDHVLKSAALPAGGDYTMRGTGTFRVLEGTGNKVGAGKLYRYSIDVEDGVTGIDLTEFQHKVEAVLSDPRSWAGHGVSLQRVDSGRIDFHVTLTSALTVRDICGYEIKLETSCFLRKGATSAADVNRVIINDSRWVRGATAYIGDLGAYRTYLINHEVGHALGHQHAHACLAGGLAPAMMEQTIGLTSAQTHKLCQANPWPYPPGVKGAPGAEAPDTPRNNEFALNGE